MESREASIQDLFLLEQEQTKLSKKGLLMGSKAFPLMSQNRSRRQNLSAAFKRLRGVFIMVLSQVLQFLMMFLVKIVNSETAIPSFQIQTIRGIVMLVSHLVVMKMYGMKMNIPKALYPHMSFRAVFSFLAISLSYYSTTIMGLHQSLTLIYLNPFFSAILGAVLLGEVFGLPDIGAILTSFAGVFFVMQPAFIFGSPEGAQEVTEAIPAYYYIFPIMAAICTAIACYIIRLTKDRVDSFTPVIFLSITLTVVSPIFCFFQGWVSMSNEAILLCVASGALGWIGQVTQSKALQTEKLSVATAIGFLQVALSFIADIVYFGDSINLLQVLGAGAIFGGLIVMSYRQLKDDGDQQNQTANLDRPLLSSEDEYSRLA